MMYDDLPRCCDCANRLLYECREETKWGWSREKKRWVCIIGRPMFDCHGVAFNTDPEQMRLTGPCGHEGKFFRRKDAT